jgi:signal peptidase II
MFQGRNGLFLLLALGIVAGLLFYERTLPADDRWTRIALGMQVGGALGNALDRVRLGHVTDFIDAYWGRHHWPTFNVADSAIVVGVGILMWRLWEMERERMQQEAVAEALGDASRVRPDAASPLPEHREGA